MNITLVISSLSGGGAERVVSNIANYLTDMGHYVTVLTVSGKTSYHINTNVKRICLGDETKTRLPKPLLNLKRIWNLNKYLRKSNTDLYVSFLPKLTFLLMKQRRWIDAPVVIAERADPHQYCLESVKKHADFKKYYAKGDAYAFQTDDARAFYESEGIDVSNSVVIPNAINPDFIRPEYEGKREKVIIGMGRLTAQKNFPMLIKAFARIADVFPDYKLVIYGEGEERVKLESLISELNLNGRVELPGYATDIVPALQKASLFVLSSDFEGMPNALAEAMALGVPSVSTDCPVGGPKYLIDGKNGILVPVGDEVALANKMLCVLKDGNLAASMGKEARTVCDRLAPDVVYGKWEAFLKSVVKHKR